jgi:hypothetical protein
MIRATVITDASWCPEDKVAGWAAWIAGDDFPPQGFSGPTLRYCKSSNDAELVAAAIGCGLAYRMFGATRILIQSDSLAVGKHLLPNLPPDIFQNCTFTFRHVKGHTTIQDSRSWANRWCDEQAKQHMRRLRP